MRAKYAVLAAFLALAIGCASFEVNSYKVVGATASLVDGAMKGWGDWVKAGKATPGDEVRVKVVYVRYQQAMSAAEVAVRVYRANHDQPSLQASLSALSASAGDLVALVEQFTKGK